MKGKDVVKALEYCVNHDECGVDCPCFSEKQEMCGDYRGLLRQCLDFIYRLKEERSKYKVKAQQQQGALARLNKLAAEQKKDIENLAIELRAMRNAANLYKAESEKYKNCLTAVLLELNDICGNLDEADAKLERGD